MYWERQVELIMEELDSKKKSLKTTKSQMNILHENLKLNISYLDKSHTYCEN